MAVEKPTAFRGFIANTLDALIVFEACRRGTLPRTTGRLSEAQRRSICSGDVFVFSEEESKIKRWTDGRRWSPSRILNNFLVYKELDGPGSMENDPVPSTISPDLQSGAWTKSPELTQSTSSSACRAHQKQGCVVCAPPSTSSAAVQDEEEEEDKFGVGRVNTIGRLRECGFVKKTISVAGLHMISYYDSEAAKKGRLRTPSSMPELKELEIHHTYLLSRYFRHPPQVTFGADGLPRFAGLTDDEPMARKPTAGSRKPRTEEGALQTDPSAFSSTQTPTVIAPTPAAAHPTDIRTRSNMPAYDSYGRPVYVSAIPFPAATDTPRISSKRPVSQQSSYPAPSHPTGLARSMSDASESTEEPLSRSRTASISGHRHEPYRLPLNRNRTSFSSGENTEGRRSNEFYPSQSARSSISWAIAPTAASSIQDDRSFAHLRSASMDTTGSSSYPTYLPQASTSFLQHQSSYQSTPSLEPNYASYHGSDTYFQSPPATQTTSPPNTGYPFAASSEPNYAYAQTLSPAIAESPAQRYSYEVHGLPNQTSYASGYAPRYYFPQAAQQHRLSPNILHSPHPQYPRSTFTVLEHTDSGTAQQDQNVYSQAYQPNVQPQSMFISGIQRFPPLPEQPQFQTSPQTSPQFYTTRPTPANLNPLHIPTTLPKTEFSPLMPAAARYSPLVGSSWPATIAEGDDLSNSMQYPVAEQPEYQRQLPPTYQDQGFVTGFPKLTMQVKPERISPRLADASVTTDLKANPNDIPVEGTYQPFAMGN